MDLGAVSHTDPDITIPALTAEQIKSLEENQLSFDFMNHDGLRSDPAFGAVPLTTGGIDFDWNLLNTNDTVTISNSGKWHSNLNQSAKISLQGDDADIEINGESVVSMLREIRDRLNIIQVSEAMEAEWDELRALREQYEAKLAECREKSQAWQALKQMPPPQTP